MTILHLVRHGQTDWNLLGRIQGTTDIPLNATGREQAARAAARVNALAGTGAPVLTSDLSRAVETAEIIARTLGLADPQPVPALRERAYGQGEGLTSPQLEERFGPAPSRRIPGAETREQLRVRAVDALTNIAGAQVGGAEAAIVVTHGAFIREVVRHSTDDRLPAEGSILENGAGYDLVVEAGTISLLAEAPAVI